MSINSTRNYINSTETVKLYQYPDSLIGILIHVYSRESSARNPNYLLLASSNVMQGIIYNFYFDIYIIYLY